MKHREFKTIGAATVTSYLFELKGQEPSLYAVKFPWWFPYQELSLALPLLCRVSFSAAVGQQADKVDVVFDIISNVILTLYVLTYIEVPIPVLLGRV